MSLATLIANTRKVLASDAAKGHVVFAAQGTLVGVTEVDIRTGCYGVDDKVRPGLSAVRVEVTVAGPESEERQAELAAVVDKHCPVLDLFQNPVPVSRELVTSGQMRSRAGSWHCEAPEGPCR